MFRISDADSGINEIVMGSLPQHPRPRNNQSLLPRDLYACYMLVTPLPAFAV